MESQSFNSNVSARDGISEVSSYHIPEASETNNETGFASADPGDNDGGYFAEHFEYQDYPDSRNSHDDYVNYETVPTFVEFSNSNTYPDNCFYSSNCNICKVNYPNDAASSKYSVDCPNRETSTDLIQSSVNNPNSIAPYNTIQFLVNRDNRKYTPPASEFLTHMQVSAGHMDSWQATKATYLQRPQRDHVQSRQQRSNDTPSGAAGFLIHIIKHPANR